MPPCRDAVLVGRTELGPDEKQAERRAKKSARSKARKQDKQNWKLVLKTNPGLGNKVCPPFPPVIFSLLLSSLLSSHWSRYFRCAALPSFLPSSVRCLLR